MGPTTGIEPRRRAGPADRAFGWVVAVETILGLVLGSFTIGRRSLWSDETVSAVVAGGGPRGAARFFVDYDATMPLYHASLAVWRHLGTGEGTLRSLSLLACAATIPVVAAIGRHLFDATTGLIAGGLVAISPFVIRYGQEARSYGMTLFLVTLAGYVLLRAVDGRSPRAWYAYAIVAALACYAHLHAGLVVLAQVIVVAGLVRPTPPRKVVLGSGGLFLVLLIPLGLITAKHGVAQITWIARPTPRIVGSTVKSLSGSAPGALLLCASALGTIVVGWRRSRGVGGRAAAWPYAFVTAWWAVPIVITLTMSLVSTPVFLARYLIVVLPGLLIAAAACIRRLPVALVVPVLLVIIVASGATIAERYRDRGPDDWRAVERFVAHRATPGDGVVFCPSYLATPFAYYGIDDARANRLETIGSPPWWPDDFDFGRPVGATFSSSSVRGAIWVVHQELGAPDPQPCPAASVLEGRTRRATARFGTIDAEQWVEDDAGD